VEAVTIDKVTMEPTLSIIGEDGQKCVGICGSGIIDMISELFRCGIINAKGLFVREGRRIARDAHGMGRYIVAFADEAEVLMPITGDYKMAESMVRRLSPELIANQGTDIGKALEVALLSFTESTHESQSRVIILITDGEAHDQNTDVAINRAIEQGVTVCAIGIGTPEGVPLEIDGEHIEDENGVMVISKLGEPLLQHIAEATGGVYTRSRNDSFGLDEVVERLNQMEAVKLAQLKFEEYDEQYQWFLGVAVLLLIVEFFVLSRRNPLLKGVRLFDRESVK
jgi:Ca-activated chloride channel family protein